MVEIRSAISGASSGAESEASPFGGDPEGFGQESESSESMATGSGFLVGEEGTVVTAAHVVDEASSVKVILQDGTVRSAEVLGIDDATDGAADQSFGVGFAVPPNLVASELSQLAAGETVSLEVERGGRPTALKVTLGTQPAESGQAGRAPGGALRRPGSGTMAAMLRAASVSILALVLVAIAPAAAAEADAGWAVTPKDYEFAPRVIGTGPSAPVDFTLTNTGTVPLRPPEFTYSRTIDGGDGTAKYVETDNCKVGLGPGESCSLAITFEPLTLGPTNEFFNLNEPERQVGSIYVHVTGSAAVPAVSLAPPVLMLPTHLLRTELTPPSVITVSNTGGADLHFSGLALINAGTNPNGFRIAGGSCGVGNTVSAGGSCTVQVTDTPTLTTFATAELQLTDNVPERITGPGEPRILPESHQTVALSGQGTSLAGAPIAQDVAIVGKPPAKSRRTWARFRFVVPDAHPKFVCKLDGAPFRACKSPAVYRHLAVGRHVFRVKPATTGRTVAGAVAAARFRVLPPARQR